MSILRNERGSILFSVIFAVLMMLLVGTILSWLNNSNFLIRYGREKSQYDNASKQILNAVESCITNLRQSSNFCPKKNEFVALLNLSNATPAPINLSWNDLTTTTNFLTAQLPLLTSALSTASATVTRMPSADDVILGSTEIVLQIQATPNLGTFSFRSVSLTKSYRVTLQIPASFALILRQTNISPRVNLQSSSKLTVYGKTLLWENSFFNPSMLISSGNFADLVLDRLYTTGTQIRLSSTSDLQIFSGLRLLGVQTRVLDGAVNPFSGAFGNAWDQPLDYANVYLTNGYPLPATNPIASHGASDPRDFVSARADVTTFPDASVMGAYSLERTCSRPPNFNVGSIQALILNRNTDDLTFNFTSAGGAEFACGQIMADEITVITPSGETVVWYGNLIANRLTVTGGGELVIVNPFSFTQAPMGLPSPANLSTADLMQMLMALGSSTGHNFFVPFTRNAATLPSTLQARTVASVFSANPCGAKLCWPLKVDPPDIGQMYSVPGCSGASTPGPGCWSENVFYSIDEVN